MFRTAIENPDLYKSIFPEGRNRVWTFHKNSGWMMKTDKKGTFSLAKMHDIPQLFVNISLFVDSVEAIFQEKVSLIESEREIVHNVNIT